MSDERRGSADGQAGSAPDLGILGDQLTLHPSGYVEPPGKAVGKEEALMEHSARFRKAPLEYVDCYSMPSFIADMPTGFCEKSRCMYQEQAGEHTSVR